MFLATLTASAEKVESRASGHHSRVCGCCYCLPAPHARVAPLRAPGGSRRSGDQSPRVHGVHIVHGSTSTNQPVAGKGHRRACLRCGAPGPVTEHHHAVEFRLPPGPMPSAARRHWQHAASNDARTQPWHVTAYKPASHSR